MRVAYDLMQKVMSLPLEDRREIFFALLEDTELNINPFDAINLRQNHELAEALREMAQSDTLKRQVESE